MKRPARYFVPHEDATLWKRELARVTALYPGVDGPEELTEPDAYWRYKEFASLAAARRFAKTVGNDVYERIGITEDPDAPGMWDYTEKMVD